MTSPGHFGYLVPPDGCNGASCLEPVNADGTNSYLYGEMTGLVGLGDNVRILNQVQLYR
jgi:hypothetical protein